MSALNQKKLLDNFADTLQAAAPERRDDGQPDSPSGLSEEARQVATYFEDSGVSPVLLSGGLRLLDGLLMMIAAVATYGWWLAAENSWQLGMFGVFFAGSLLGVAVIQAANGYAPTNLKQLFGSLGRAIAGWFIAIGTIAVASYLLNNLDLPMRTWLGAWFIAGLGYFILTRLIVSALVRKWASAGYLERRTVIVGGGQSAEQLIRDLEADPQSDIRICGVFDDRSDDRSPPIIAGYPKLGNLRALVEFARLARIDTLIVTIPLTAESRMLEMLKTLWVLPVDIRLSAHTNKLKFRPRSYSYIGSVPTLEVANRPIADWDHLIKATFDRVCAAVLIVLLSPILLAAAAAVKLSSKGPIIFKQQRHGFNNQLIGIYKFRSMYTDMSDAKASKLVTKNDPRVTPVGRFLRKSSIDELPQLFNVLKGELSLVGPRPHALEAKAANQLYADVVDGYFARHRVKPGITGWAQINGWRGETDTQDKIKHRTEHDLYYIENWSIWFDLYILMMTPLRLVNTESAY